MGGAGVPAYILAGGKSSRFGSDKARVPVAGQPLLLRLIEGVQAEGQPVQVVADRGDRYADLGLTCLADAIPDHGPAAGLLTAMEHTVAEGHEWLMLLSCDQLVWLPEWSSGLLAAVKPSLQAVCFAADRAVDSAADKAADARPQPLPALYHGSLLPLVRRAAQQSDSLKAVLANAKIQILHHEIAPVRWSFNTPAELQALQAQLPD